ncbi:MAG: hypothetical protein ACRDQY_12555, partial [Pseudonocardiaceae bacterium]
GQRVGMADVEVLTQQITHLSKLGQEFGSGRVREQVVVLLHREATTLLHGSCSDKTGKALLCGVAQATRLAGFMAADTGRDALAQRYYIQALDLAMRAGDRLYAAFVLATMSRMTARTGDNTPTEHDTARHGRQTVALARAGLTITQSAATPALAAELHALEAQGLALLGEATAARRAALTAQRAYESVRPGRGGPVAGLLHQSRAHRGRRLLSQQCWRDQGDPHPVYHGVAGLGALAGPRPVAGPDPHRPRSPAQP